MIKIFVSENSKTIEMESIEKGCRSDVLVQIGKKYYKPFVNTIERLAQEVEEAFENSELYEIEPCQIIVKEANTKAIVETILYLHHNHYFDHFVPVHLNILYENGFQYLSNIENWIQIY